MVRFTIDTQNRLIFYGNLVGYAQPAEKTAVVDVMFQGDELAGYLKRLQLTPCWKEGVFDRLASGQMPAAEDGTPLKRCRVWQLKQDVDIRKRFIDYDKVLEQFGEPDQADYLPVYDGEMGTNDLEEIYTRCSQDHLEGYLGRSMSMSDVVELYDQSGSEFYYCDRVGFRPIRFAGQEQASCKETKR